MDQTTSRDTNGTRKFDKDLVAQIKTGNTSYALLEETLGQIRDVCSRAIFADYQAAKTDNVEERLWHSHQQVNTHYRQMIGQMKKSQERNAVAQRKLGAEYLKFIKTSQKFYREFIGKLSAAYGNIPALQRVAKKFEITEQARGSPKALGYPGPAELEQCCHRTLIRLGDFSRYREMELVAQEEDRDWAPAIGYYDLALTVCPGSGQPFNQRAIIALSSKNLFRATYYAYRSLTAEDPHPQASDNLRSIMNRISKAWDKGELTTDANAAAGATLPASVVASFLRLLQQYSQGVESTSTPELETEVCTRLKSCLQQEPEEPAPVKLVLSSIAAQQAAQNMLMQQPDKSKWRNSFVSYLQLNTRIFTTLLETLDEALKSYASTKINGGLDPWPAVRALTPLVRRVLPVIRLYSLWLSRFIDVMSSDFVREELKQGLWTALADTLSSVSMAFPANLLPNIEHLLEEDEEIIRYPPLHSADDIADTMTKSRWHDLSDDTRDATREMLFRVKEFLVAGLGLAIESDAPLSLDAQTSTFSSSFSARPNRPRVLTRPAAPTVAVEVKPGTVGNIQTPEKPAPSPAVRIASRQTTDNDAERMVESLVGADEFPAKSANSHSLVAPRTPARANAIPSTFGTASPFPCGSNTVADIMAKTFRQGSPRHGGPGAIRPDLSVRGPSLAQLPATGPTLPRHQSHGSDRSNGDVDIQRIWETPIGEPLARRTSGQPASPSLGTRASPLTFPRSHSHTGSNELSSNIWSTNVANANPWPSAKIEPLSMSRSTSSRNLQNLGNGTFGAVSPGLSDFQANSTDYGWGNSSLQPGLPSPTQSPWNPEPRHQKRLSGGSPLASTQSQLATAFGGHDSVAVGQSPALRQDNFAQAKTFRPSNLQHATAQKMT